MAGQPGVCSTRSRAELIRRDPRGNGNEGASTDKREIRGNLIPGPGYIFQQNMYLIGKSERVKWEEDEDEDEEEAGTR